MVEIPEAVLKMVAGFLGIDRQKALEFVDRFHTATTTVLNNQEEIMSTLRYLKARADSEDSAHITKAKDAA